MYMPESCCVFNFSIFFSCCCCCCCCITPWTTRLTLWFVSRISTVVLMFAWYTCAFFTLFHCYLYVSFVSLFLYGLLFFLFSFLFFFLFSLEFETICSLYFCCCITPWITRLTLWFVSRISTVILIFAWYTRMFFTSVPGSSVV